MNARVAAWHNIVAIGLLVLIVGSSLIGTDYDSDEAVYGFHDLLLTLDSHVDIPPDYTQVPESDPGLRGDMQVDLVKMDEGGLDGAFFIVYVGQGERTVEGYAKAREEALVKFDAIHRMADALYPERIELAYHPADVTRIAQAGKKVALIGIENGFVVGTDLSLLDDYYARGARYVTLAHNGHNDIADSAQPQERLGDEESEHRGLSVFGVRVIERMNKLGMMVDVSHISQDAMMQAVKLSKAPVIASHSATKALADHPRNLTDEQMRALAAKGGVMQVVAFRDYVHVDPARTGAVKALRDQVAQSAGAEKFSYTLHGKLPAWRNGMKAIYRQYPQANLGRFIDHIDHAVKVMGIDHVGISSDFGGGGGVNGWDSAAETPEVTAELLRRGYSEQEVAKLWGRNLLRVWAEVEQVAAEMDADR